MRGPSAPHTHDPEYWKCSAPPVAYRPQRVHVQTVQAGPSRSDSSIASPQRSPSDAEMRAARLRRTADIARVRSQGTSRNDRLFVIHVLPTVTGELRVAVSASRALGTAVARNRARRRIREAIRVALRERQTAGAADVLVVARPAVRDVPVATLRAAVDRALHAVLE